MELTDLVTFSAVARSGGITRAAEELNTVQSNVTQRVKALEAEIGTALFERHSRGMTLTGAGRRLFPYAERMAGEGARSLPRRRTPRRPPACRNCSPNFTGASLGCSSRSRQRRPPTSQ